MDVSLIYRFDDCPRGHAGSHKRRRNPLMLALHDDNHESGQQHIHDSKSTVHPCII